MKKVLIAIDYDPSAQKVAESGYSLGKAMNAEITLLHIIADAVYYSSLQYSPIMGFNGMNSPDLMPPVENGKLNKAAIGFLERTKTHLRDESIHIITEEGETAASILKIATEKGFDIIVMGSHSRSGLDKIVMGSVTEEVLHKSTIPLYIIPIQGEKEQGH